jgi:hypothetical protein
METPARSVYSANSVARQCCGNRTHRIESRPDRAPVSILRDRDGHSVMELERAELDGLPQSFRWPEIVKTKAADGTTDINGTEAHGWRRSAVREIHP